MRTFPLFNVTHIYLNKDQGIQKPAECESGHYLVFWWKEIPLGQLFIEPNEIISEEKYIDSFLKSISPSIAFYAKEDIAAYDEWKTGLMNKQFTGLTGLLTRLLENWMPSMLPLKVPVSVIICTRDRADYLRKCLTKLQTLSCLPEEIIVVDNGPKDDSTQMVVAAFKNIRYVREIRGGLSIARNTGLLHASYPIIAFTDDDAIVHPLWIYRVWETFADPVVAAMCGLVISLKLDTEAQVIFEKNWTFNRGFTDKKFDSGYFNSTIQDGTPVWEIGAGVNMAFKKSVFDEVGNFDTRLGAGASGCSEDSELWYRMLMKGMVIQYNPRAIMHHEHRKDIKGLKKQIFAYMRGHTAAALLQHDMYQQSGYKRRIFRSFPKSYFRALVKGFPLYRFHFITLLTEIKGILSGLAFYNKEIKKRSL